MHRCIRHAHQQVADAANRRPSYCFIDFLANVVYDYYRHLSLHPTTSVREYVFLKIILHFVSKKRDVLRFFVQMTCEKSLEKFRTR